MDQTAPALLSPLASSVFVAALAGVFAFLVALAVFAPRVTAVARRDLVAVFSSPVAYVTLIFFALLGGNSFYNSIQDMVQQDEPSLARAFLGIWSAALLVSPVLTMKLFAEERERGTLELLLTTVTRPWEIVLGKYLAAMCLYGSLLALTFFYYVAMVRVLHADIDHGEVLSGYLGMMLFGSALMSIGLMVSAFCRNAVSAVVFTLGIDFALLFLGTGVPQLQKFLGKLIVGVYPTVASSFLEQVNVATESTLQFLSLSGHLMSFLQGRIAMSDVAYHLSVTAFCLTMVHVAIQVKK